MLASSIPTIVMAISTNRLKELYATYTMFVNYANTLHVAATNVLIASTLAHSRNRTQTYRHASIVVYGISIRQNDSSFLH